MHILHRITVSIFSLLFWSLQSSSAPAWEDSPYFDTTFLSNYDQVRSSLCTDGFKEVCITTEDGFNLNGLLLERPEATSSVIVCCGFYPGRKEGMATLYKILPDTCNILFFDSRGHGTSEGPFWSALYRYGKNEYRDVLGAIEFMHERADKPIIIHGICAGSFHAARALIHLDRKKLRTHYKVQGLIFDSGLSSILESADIPRKHFQLKIVPALLKTYLYKKDTKQKVRERYLYHATWFMVARLMSTIEFCVKPFLRSQETETKLYDKIETITCPIFYIHAQNDTYSSYESIIALAQKTQHAQSWWIPASEHAENHLKHKHEYRIRVCDFIAQTSSSAT